MHQLNVAPAAMIAANLPLRAPWIEASLIKRKSVKSRKVEKKKNRSIPYFSYDLRKKFGEVSLRITKVAAKFFQTRRKRGGRFSGYTVLDVLIPPPLPPIRLHNCSSASQNTPTLNPDRFYDRAISPRRNQRDTRGGEDY